MKKNSLVKLSAILSAGIMAVSAGMTAVSANEADNTLSLVGREAYAGEIVEVPMVMDTDNQCDCYELVVEYDSRLQLIAVEGASASNAYEKDGKTYVALTGFTTTHYQDGEATAKLKLYAPIDSEEDEYFVKFDTVANFATEFSEIENYVTEDTAISVKPVFKTREAQKYHEFKIYQKFDSNGNLIESFVGYRGDSNGDGKLNIRDAAAIARACASKKILDEKDSFFGDVNEDGKLNIRDAAAIARYFANGQIAWENIIK